MERCRRESYLPKESDHYLGGRDSIWRPFLCAHGAHVQSSTLKRRYKLRWEKINVGWFRTPPGKKLEFADHREVESP